MNSVIYHTGIKGMKWGVRRYQNADGTLTEEGKKRYLRSDGKFNAVGMMTLPVTRSTTMPARVLLPLGCSESSQVGT